MQTIYAIYADIGGTNARFATQKSKDSGVFENIKVYTSTNFNSPAELILRYLNDYQLIKPEYAVIAIAGPVTNDKITVTNLAWQFSIKDIQEQVAIDHVYFFNDFEALGASLPYLKPEERIQIGQGHPQEKAPFALIGPGTGVGSAHLEFNGHYYQVHSAEGGQATYAPQDSEEIEILAFLMKKYKKAISIEDLLSGSRGFSDLLDALANIHGLQPPKWSAQELLQEALHQSSPLANLVLARYCKILGHSAMNLALMTGATGGVFIGGGIVPRFKDYLLSSNFRQSFENHPLIEDYLKAIPTYLITAQYPAFIGLQHTLKTQLLL